MAAVISLFCYGKEGESKIKLVFKMFVQLEKEKAKIAFELHIASSGVLQSVFPKAKGGGGDRQRTALLKTFSHPNPPTIAASV